MWDKLIKFKKIYIVLMSIWLVLPLMVLFLSINVVSPVDRKVKKEGISSSNNDDLRRITYVNSYLKKLESNSIQDSPPEEILEDTKEPDVQTENIEDDNEKKEEGLIKVKNDIFEY